MELIPSLPNDLAIQCLIRVPRIYHPMLQCVCKEWRNAIRSKAFFETRNRNGFSNTWIYAFGENAESLQVFWPEKQQWRKIPRVEDKSFVCMAGAAVDSKIYFFGRYDAESLSPCNEVLLFDVFSNRFEVGMASPLDHGDEMAVAALDKQIFVLKCSNKQQDPNFRYSVEVYDTESETWTVILDQELIQVHYSTAYGTPYAFARNGKYYACWSTSYSMVYDLQEKSWSKVEDDTSLWNLTFRSPCISVSNEVYTHFQDTLAHGTLLESKFILKKVLSIPNLFHRLKCAFFEFEGGIILTGGTSSFVDVKNEVYHVDITKREVKRLPDSLVRIRTGFSFTF